MNITYKENCWTDTKTQDLQSLVEDTALKSTAELLGRLVVCLVEKKVLTQEDLKQVLDLVGVVSVSA